MPLLLYNWYCVRWPAISLPGGFTLLTDAGSGDLAWREADREARAFSRQTANLGRQSVGWHAILSFSNKLLWQPATGSMTHKMERWIWVGTGGRNEGCCLSARIPAVNYVIYIGKKSNLFNCEQVERTRGPQTRGQRLHLFHMNSCIQRQQDGSPGRKWGGSTSLGGWRLACLLFRLEAICQHVDYTTRTERARDFAHSRPPLTAI